MQEVNKQPLVAIALPVYNRVKYFRECLQHIQDQTYTNWVCYITDNACTDGSEAIALEFAQKDSRFKVFRNPETYPAYHNWNVALGRLKDVPAKYIKFECSDDWFYPDFLEKMVALHEKYDNLGAVYAYRLAGNKVDCDGLDINEGEVFDGKDLVLRSVKNGLYIYGGLSEGLYRKETVMSVNPELKVINEDNIHCDIEMNDNICLHSEKVGFVYQVLSYYRFHEGQILSFAQKADTYKFERERRLYLMMQEFPNDKDLPRLYGEARREYALFLANCRRKGENDIVKWHEEHLERPLTKEELKAEKKTVIGRTRRLIRTSIAKIMATLKAR
ncbi:MAG: glycosyltransferase family 2 protein [Bacteroidales bacterium]|nr:glycosyltransferase family 2 protein [Bacteroidales bacterium]